MKKVFKRGCGLLGLALWTGVTSLSASPSGLDPQAVDIATSIRDHNYDAGLHNADMQLQRDPRNSTLLRLKGICLLKENKVNEAVVTLRAALAADEESTAARYYLAQALAEQGNTLESVRLLERVQRDAPGSDYGQLATAILPQLRGLTQTVQEVPPHTAPTSAPRRYNINLRVAGEYDDNVPERAPDETGTGEKQSFVLATSQYLELRPVDQKVDASPVTLGIGYTGYQNLHDRTSLRAYDVIQHTGSLYVQKDDTVDGMPVQGHIGGAFEYTELGGNFYSRTLNGNASFSIQPANWTATVLRYNISGEHFASANLPDFFSRDGLEQQVGFTQYFYLLQNQLILGVGYSHCWDDTTGSLFQLDSHIATLSLQASLPEKVTLHALGQYQSANYVDYTPTPERLDGLYTATIAFSRPLFTDDLSVEVAYTHESADSSVDFANYHRNIISLSLNFNY